MPSYPKLVMPSGKPRNRFMRTLRAIYRDSSALLTEFRRPLMVFLLATVGGGLLYGELMVIAGQDRLPFYDLPYLMVSLMALEAPTDIPREPYLIIFWYLMPAVAVYVLGRGASDFIRLFFNRDERRDAWEEAVASTYRDHVIVLGVGHLGLRVTRTLVQMGFDVVVIDEDLKAEIDDDLSDLGVPAIIADGRQIATLEKAGIAYARSFIACTSSDYVNLEAIMRARDMMNPHLRIVARMWDDQFAKQLEQNMGVHAVISASDLAAPAFAGAAVGVEITQMLRLKGQEYSMIRMTVAPNSMMVSSTIDQLQRHHQMDIVLHASGEALDVHPEGDIVIHAGDQLVLFAQYRKIAEITAENEQAGYATQNGHVVVMGVGHVGLRVTRALRDMGFPVTVIDLELKPDYSSELIDRDVQIIREDGRHAATLEMAGIGHARAFVACTSSDYVNLEAIMRARDMNPTLRIISRMWDNQFAKQLEQYIGIQSVISASDLAAPAFAGAAVNVQITQTLRLKGHEYSLIRMTAAARSLMDGSTVDEMQRDHHADIVLHARGDNVDVHPAGSIRIQAGDQLVLFASHSKVTELVEQNQENLH